MKRKIIIPGGSGYLGRALTNWFAKKGAEVVILSRTPSEIPGARVLPWDGRTLGDWTTELEGATAVINLAGRTVNCRYNEHNREEILNSRVHSTLVIGEAIARAQQPPEVWLNSSTATIYRHRFDAANTEDEGLYGPEREAKDAFSLEVAHRWEEAFATAYATHDLAQTCPVILRTAIVFGEEKGGVYETLQMLARLGLGGRMGHGRQFVSWIHEEDFCRAIEWLIAQPEASGAYNLAAPEPLPNHEMMRILRGSVGAKFGLPAARWMLELGALFLRTETELIVKSRRVVPERLLREGFSFHFQQFESVIADLASPAR